MPRSLNQKVFQDKMKRGANYIRHFESLDSLPLFCNGYQMVVALIVPSNLVN